MKSRILLVGDSIRRGYAPLVRQELIETADVIEIPENGRDSLKMLESFPGWLAQAGGDAVSIIHFNCGLHDIKRPHGSEVRQQPLDAYVQNLRRLVEWLRGVKARLIWASTTPVIFERHHEKKPTDRSDSDVRMYNASAREIMEEYHIPIDDLYEVIRSNSPENCIGPDGVHMTPHGYGLLAEAVCRKVREYL